MPNRILREGHVRSRRLAACASADAKVLWFCLVSVADDFGRFAAEPALVRSAVFPRELDRVTEAMVAEWLDELARVRLLGFYQAGADRLLQLFNFGQRVRGKSKFPGPPVELLDGIEEPKDSPARSDAVCTRPDSAPRAARAQAADIPRADGARTADIPRAARAQSAAVFVVEGEGEIGGVGEVVVGPATAAGRQPPTHTETDRAGPKGVVTIPVDPAPPPVRREDGGCPTCLDILAHFAERTGRAYPLAGTIARHLHRAHLETDAGLLKQIIDEQHAKALDGTDPKGWKYLHPQVCFEPANLARLVNERKLPESDVERGRRRREDINRQLGLRS